MWRSQLQVPLLPQAGVFLGSPKFYSSAMFVNSQWVCFLPDGAVNLGTDLCSFRLLVLNIVPEKPLMGSGQVMMVMGMMMLVMMMMMTMVMM